MEVAPVPTAPVHPLGHELNVYVALLSRADLESPGVLVVELIHAGVDPVRPSHATQHVCFGLGILEETVVAQEVLVGKVSQLDMACAVPLPRAPCLQLVTPTALEAAEVNGAGGACVLAHYTLTDLFER